MHFYVADQDADTRECVFKIEYRTSLLESINWIYNMLILSKRWNLLHIDSTSEHALVNLKLYIVCLLMRKNRSLLKIKNISLKWNWRLDLKMRNLCYGSLKTFVGFFWSSDQSVILHWCHDMYNNYKLKLFLLPAHIISNTMAIGLSKLNSVFFSENTKRDGLFWVPIF